MPPVITHVDYDGATTVNVAWSSGASPNFLIGLFQVGVPVKKSPLFPTGARQGSLITDGPLTGLDYRVAVSQSDGGDDVDGWGGQAAVVTARAAGVTASYNLRSVTANWTMQGEVAADMRLTVTLFDAAGKQGEQQVSGTSVVFPTPALLRGDVRLEFQVKTDVTAGPLVTVPVAVPAPPEAARVDYDADPAHPKITAAFAGSALAGCDPSVTLLRDGAAVSTATGTGTQVTVAPAGPLALDSQWAVTLAWVAGDVTGPRSVPVAVITARATDVSVQHSPQAVTASWTPQGTAPAGAPMIVNLRDADGERVHEPVTRSSVTLPLSKPLGAQPRLEFQVTTATATGPLVTVPVITSAPRPPAQVSYDTGPGGQAQVAVTFGDTPPAGCVPAVLLLRDGAAYRTATGDGTRVTVSLDDPLPTGPRWAVTLAWASGGLTGPQSEPVELITAPPAIEDAEMRADGTVVVNWRPQAGPPWVTSGLARLDAPGDHDRPAQAVTATPGVFTPSPALKPRSAYTLTLASVRGVVRGPASASVLLLNVQTAVGSTSYDGQTVDVWWSDLTPAEATGCLVEILAGDMAIATGPGDGTASGALREIRGSVPCKLDKYGSYTARLRWVCGTVTGPPGPETLVISGWTTVGAVQPVADGIEMRISDPVPSMNLPVGTVYYPHLIKRGQDTGQGPAVSQPPATVKIGDQCGDQTTLVIRAQAGYLDTSTNCVSYGPLGPPAPVLAIPPVITRAVLRGTVLDVSWTLPPDPLGAVCSTTVEITPSGTGSPPAPLRFPGLTGSHASLDLGSKPDHALSWTATAVVSTDGPFPSVSPPSPGVPLLTAAPGFTTVTVDGQTVSARWNWPDDPANAALATGYRLELLSGTTRAGRAVVGGLAGQVTLDRPLDPAVPLRLAVSPLAGAAEYAADPGPTLIGAPPVLTKAESDFDHVRLAWDAAPDPGSVVTGYQAVFSTPGPAGGTAEVVSLGLTSPAKIGIPPAFDPLTPTQVAVRAVGTAGGTAVAGPSTAPVRLPRQLPDLPLTIEAAVTDGWLQLNWLPVLGDPEGYDVQVTTDGIVRRQRITGTSIRMFLDGKSHRDAEVTIAARRGVAATVADRRTLILSPPEMTEVDWDGSVLTAVWKVLTNTTADVLAYELTVRNGDVVVGTSLLDHLVTATGTYTTSLALPPASAGLFVRVAGLRPGSRGVDSPPVQVPAPGPAPASVTIDPVTGKATVTWAAMRPAPTIGYLVQRYRAGRPDGDPVTVPTGTRHELTVDPVAYDDLEVAIAVRTAAGTATVTGPFGPRLRVPTEPAQIRDVDFDGRTASVSWVPVPGATGYALDVNDGHAPVASTTAAGDQTTKRFALTLTDPGPGHEVPDYQVTVQPLRGASSGVRSTAPLVGDGLYVLPGPARIVRASTARVIPQPALAYLPDLTATGQPLTGLPIAPSQAGESLPPFTLEQAPSTAAPMKYRLRIENGALAFGATRGALAAAYRELLSTAEANGAAPRGILALQQAVARLMPQTLSETLYYSYGLSTPVSAQGWVDLRPGMVLRVAFSSFDLTAVSGAPPWSSGYAGGTVLDYEIGDHAGPDGSWLVGFDAFIDWLVTQGALTVSPPQTPSAPGGGSTQSGGADAADLSYPLFSQPFYRLLVPSTLQDPAKPANSATNQQFTIAAAAKWQQIDAATAAPGGGVHVAYFRGRAVLRACIRVEADGAEHVVPVGTTVGNLLDRMARRPPWASLGLRGARLYRAPGSAVLPGPAVLDPAKGYDAAALSRVRLDWHGPAAWPAGSQDALSLPLLHGDRIVFGAGT